MEELTEPAAHAPNASAPTGGAVSVAVELPEEEEDIGGSCGALLGLPTTAMTPQAAAEEHAQRAARQLRSRRRAGNQ